VPLNWARTQNNLGKALRVLGRRLNDADVLREALRSTRQARKMVIEVAGLVQYKADFDARIDEIEADIDAFENKVTD